MHAILERYGITETNMNASNPYDGERVAGTVGLPLPGVEIVVTDTETGGELAPSAASCADRAISPLAPSGEAPGRPACDPPDRTPPRDQGRPAACCPNVGTDRSRAVAPSTAARC